MVSMKFSFLRVVDSLGVYMLGGGQRRRALRTNKKMQVAKYTLNILLVTISYVPISN